MLILFINLVFCQELDGTYTVQYVRNHGHEVESETGNFKKKRRRISATERLRDEKDKLKTDLCALIDGEF